MDPLLEFLNWLDLRYPIVLVPISFSLALFFLGVITLQLFHLRLRTLTHGTSGPHRIILHWVIHLELFWLTQVVLRLVDYRGPSVLISLWHAIIDIHAGLAIAMSCILYLRHDRKIKRLSSNSP